MLYDIISFSYKKNVIYNYLILTLVIDMSYISLYAIIQVVTVIVIKTQITNAKGPLFAQKECDFL